jgi:glycosyltransferase involved in cell wall biosynthesis
MIDISVVMTILNCRQYLKDSIESILNQTYKSFEFIIVDDGSTDGSHEVVNLYNDSRILYIRNKDNKRIPSRRNEAIHLAKGNFIAIQDGDDISYPDRLEKQISFLDIFCVGGHADKINPEGLICGSMDYPPAVHDDMINMLLQKSLNPLIDPTTMFRRSDFVRLGGYTLDKEIYTVPDLDLWVKAILSGNKLANLQSKLIKYRVNPEGMTSIHKREMIKSHVIVWKKFTTGFYGLPSKDRNAKQ